MRKKYYYHNVEIANYKELANALGVNRVSISVLRNPYKRLLLQLGLTYKNKLDKENGFDYCPLETLHGSFHSNAMRKIQARRKGV